MKKKLYIYIYIYIYIFVIFIAIKKNEKKIIKKTNSPICQKYGMGVPLYTLNTCPKFHKDCLVKKGEWLITDSRKVPHPCHATIPSGGKVLQ